ncbi:ExbD/TolR family protein [Luteimonas sp. 50]|uniref:ExbD/TolR family protein n=1 Tax=Cognatiluteimonas sedimenti TaxID=2927791 RepID=A0ABT0A486_9GAMM|nr:ExbD/TolR family protein [Lysobacter sedimenti]MCJ0825794.1 ExbD/TolR family protein [Lysobacter sedimenti]
MTATGRRIRKRKLKAEINVVPYIDVMLVLLIIFMVTAPLLNLGVDVKLPQVAAASVEQPRQQVVVQVGEDGALSLIQKDEQGPADKIALDADELLLRVAAIRNQNPNLVVFVAGDGAVPYARVIEILQRLRTEAKVEKATLLTSSPEPAQK